MGPREVEREERDKRQEHARREVVAMLGALEAHAHQAVELTQAALRDPRPGNLAFWRAFRAKIDDFRALVSLINLRLPGLEGARADALGQEFRRLDAAMLTLYVRTAGVHFRAMLDRAVLPLVAHDVLRPELALLDEALARLAGGEEASPRLAASATAARADLEEVLRRVPALPDFDEPDAPADPPRLAARDGLQ
ncbi:hypothetical protein [Arenibaculum sp.]|uniref:hypothetical protein n=1 Tax=Arenibaculum sp. TaxID=2865862 RepID=UPI002E14E18E|nr:hypothetical protein [Arenibaculum sp.]